MTSKTYNVIVAAGTIVLAICAVGTLALSYRRAPKPLGEGATIVRRVALLTGFAAAIGAFYFLIATVNPTPVLLCAVSYFVVQVVFFAPFSRAPARRGEIFSIVLAAVFLTTFPMLAVMKNMVKMDSDIVSIVRRVTDRLPPSPSASQTPHQ
jgi:hypothetical protein